jgi:hypothetical protein
MINVTRGMLVEYAAAAPPLVLTFELNPQTVRRSRTLSIETGTTPGTRGGYAFALPTETPRAAQGVQVSPETLSLRILLDATDRMSEGDPIARDFGVTPELDTLRSMLEPKTQGPGGVQVLSGLGLGDSRAFPRDVTPSVLLFVWGEQVLPVFLTSVEIEELAHRPGLVPYRAQVDLRLQVVESPNPFYQVEKARQAVSAGRASTVQAGSFLGGLF